MTIYAAGVVCWRERRGQLEVLLVYRTQYRDWSFPKGKVDPGETLPETAVREMLEETGVKVRLGRKLSTLNYQVPSGADKEVHYWASKLKEKAWKEAKFQPNKEIQRLAWVEVNEALETVTYVHDRQLLVEIMDFHKRQELETRALILLRHATATPRDQWPGEEAKRPLLPEGKKQAKRLVKVLAAYSPKRLVTSPWTRCHQTVEPYANATKKRLINRSQLTELASALSPRKTTHAVEDLFDASRSALLCSHRPALPTITKTLATRAVNEIKDEVLAANTLQPGEFVVLRLSMGKKPKFVAIERVMPTS